MKSILLKRFALLLKILLSAVGMLALLLWFSGVFDGKMPPGKVARAPGLPLPADAGLFTVKKEAVPARVDSVGTVTSEVQVQLSARMSAYVREVLASAGDAVVVGQPLALLDDRGLQAQRASAEAALRRASTEFDRAKRLHETKAATDQELIAAESAFLGAQAQLEEIRVMLTYTRIESPIQGTITDRHIESGSLVNAGQVMMSVYDPAAMRLDVPVPVRLVDFVRIGAGVSVRLERPDAVVKGRVHRIVSEIDPRSRTQTVQILLETGPLLVLPGTFGRLSLETAPRTAHPVPASAVLRSGQLEMVHAVENGRVIRRLVRTAPLDEGRLDVLSGVSDGDTLLVHPLLPR